jgi:hypothetical protein
LFFANGIEFSDFFVELCWRNLLTNGKVFSVFGNIFRIVWLISCWSFCWGDLNGDFVGFERFVGVVLWQILIGGLNGRQGI